jgi:uncharacterized damage-inducible protein DinB
VHENLSAINTPKTPNHAGLIGPIKRTTRQASSVPGRLHTVFTSSLGSDTRPLSAYVTLQSMASTATDYATLFASHRNPLTALLEKLPADQAEFKAWEEGMTFKRLTDHLSASTMRFGFMLQGQQPPKFEPTTDWNAALNRLRDSTTSAQATIAALTPETLARVIPAFGGGTMPISGLMDFMVAHEAHHKGQIWMMARMIGVEPPMFMKV